VNLLGRIAGIFRGARPGGQTIRVVRERAIRGSYDLAQTTDGNKNHWAAADNYNADSANSKSVRSTTVKRSRYETGNNGYLKGITRTQAAYVVGRGPKLRMQTISPGFNAMVEAAWRRWAAKVKLARKLRTAVKAKVTDGEAFLIARQNPGLDDPVKLDLMAVECEQVTSTDLLWAEKNRVDGVRFDDFGNPLFYDILPYHPGGQYWPMPAQADRVEARFVFHLFQEERPGQHRAIPELSSTLNTCAQSRRWREATIAAAENLADFSLFVKTESDPQVGPGQLLPFDTFEIQRGMMTSLPAGGDAFQPKAEQPAATYEAFNRCQIGEQARPLSMAYALAACDSSNSNFASAKLDQHPYFAAVDVEQAEIEEAVLEPLFSLWFLEAIRQYRWGGDRNLIPPHTWDWPARPQIDEVKTSTSRQIDLSTGVKSPRRIAAEDGYDWEEELQATAEDYGVTIEEVRGALFAANFQKTAAPPDTAAPQDEESSPSGPNGNGRMRSRT